MLYFKLFILTFLFLNPGTLFTSKPLADNKLTKKFVSVFAKRVASTAKTNSPQICECHSDKNGIPYTECTTQTYLSAINFDFVSNISVKCLKLFLLIIFSLILQQLLRKITFI